MKRSLTILLVLVSFGLSVFSQNLVQNPSFENLPNWDEFWYLSLTDPSTPSAVATPITTDAHEGTTSVELSNTGDKEWTYFYSDVVSAPIHLLKNRSYEVRGWIKSVEEGKRVSFEIMWDGGWESIEIYYDNPNPVSNPDWFLVKDTITIWTDANEGFLRLGLWSDKDMDKNPVGKVRFDDFSVTLIPDDTDADILAFTFPEQLTPEVIDPVLGIVHIELPFGTDLGTLAPDSIALSRGAVITPGQGVARDFRLPLVYSVTSQDGSNTRDWTITVTTALPSSASAITSFTLPELIAPATINRGVQLVLGRVPYGTDLTTLVPNIEVSPGATINPMPVVLTDFTNPVTYIVTAQNGTTSQDWVVAVLEEANTETDISSFDIPELDAPATINNSLHTVMGTVPFGTDLSALLPSIEVSGGASINPLSDVTNDFSSPVIYTVTADDGVTVQDWVVSIQVLPNTATEITSFDIAELVAPASIDMALHTVTGMVLYGTDLSALLPTIEVSEGASINPLSGTACDFSSPVSFTVTAEDGTTRQDWVVSIQVAPNTETDITEFSLADQTGAASIDPVTHTVDIEVYSGTNLGFLTPIILVSSGATMDPQSGVSRDFSLAVQYTVTAEDGITLQIWTINVSLAPANTETDIIGFSIPQLLSPAVIDNSLHTVSGTVAFGTDLTARVTTIAVSRGATIDPASGMLTDLSSPAIFKVTAEDGITTQDWVVSIVALPNTETDIIEFSLAEQTGPSTINLTDHTVEIEVSSGTDLTSLTPSIEVSSGAMIDPADGVSRDFTDAVEYLVTADDGINSQNWTVTVNVARAVGIGTSSFESIRIYPNPASEFIFIELKGDTHIRLHDLMGKMHFSADHMNGDQRINVSDYKEGIYIISLHMEDGSLQQKKLIVR